jgi:TonB family protein
MPAVEPAVKVASHAPVPKLLVELPSRPRLFFGNFRDIVLPRRLTPLELGSAPAEFWPDVFVERNLPWRRFLESIVYHAIAGTLLIGLTRFFALQPRVVAKPAFEHSQVIYYSASDFLPPLDTRETSAAQPRKADPEFSRQPIISLPPEADNRSQTIVAPPNLKLKHDIALPNMVAWSDDARQPRLAIPDAPLSPAAEITRMAPRLENSVVSPPVDATRVNQRRNAPALQNSVVAPPPELRASNSPSSYAGLQPALIAPPPDVQVGSARPLGDMNIAPTALIAPAPQLPVAAQRTAPSGRLSGIGGSPVVPPPPSLPGSGSSASSFGSRGHVIALNLHPAVGAPPDPPAGNRRGTFAATPDGRSGASGSPGTVAAGKENKTGSRASNAAKGNLPSGLYVGKTAEVSSAVAGDAGAQKASSQVNPNLIASARPPSVHNAEARPSESAVKLSEAERAVFAGRKFYSLTLNMPNLNSAGGSWVIRFAEKNHETTNPGNDAVAANLSQPMATRKVDPAYPLQLMRENVAGTVILYAVIHADGSVGNVRILRGVDERLDRFAAEAVAQWKFNPATRNGSPVDVEATFQIPFRPSRVGTNF